MSNDGLLEKVLDECLKNPKSLFFPLTEEQKEELNNAMLCSFYQKDERIYNEGEEPTGLIYLVEGNVKIAKEGVGGREQIVQMVNAHNFIGYRAMFAGEKTIASATALTPVHSCLIPFDIAIKMIHANSNFALNIIKSFALTLGFTSSRTVTLTQKHIRGRLAESLLLLGVRYGYQEDGKTLNIGLSREDVAKLSNMTPSNAIRTLSAFASEGVISLQGRIITIEDKRTLEKISRLG